MQFLFSFFRFLSFSSFLHFSFVHVLLFRLVIFFFCMHKEVEECVRKIRAIYIQFNGSEKWSELEITLCILTFFCFVLFAFQQWLMLFSIRLLCIVRASGNFLGTFSGFYCNCCVNQEENIEITWSLIHPSHGECIHIVNILHHKLISYSYCHCHQTEEEKKKKTVSKCIIQYTLSTACFHFTSVNLSLAHILHVRRR